MSQENVEMVRRSYEVFNRTFEDGRVDPLVAFLEAHCRADVVLKPSGLLPETAEMHGHDGLVRFATLQMEAFRKLRVEPEDLIDHGNRVVVPLRFGGEARHTGLPVEFFVVHVVTLRDGKVARVDMYQTKEEALEAAGLSE